ncbi:hypothetical protein ACJW31_09G171500 [Castanea mollissima]
MIMGYLSGSSPLLKSGTVSTLSVLVYSDVDICLSMPDLVPLLLSLLHTKVVEVIKNRHWKTSPKNLVLVIQK